MKATYNLTTNRFKLYTGDERLTAEQVTESLSVWKLKRTTPPTM